MEEAPKAYAYKGEVYFLNQQEADDYYTNLFADFSLPRKEAKLSTFFNRITSRKFIIAVGACVLLALNAEGSVTQPEAVQAAEAGGVGAYLVVQGIVDAVTRGK